MNWLTNIISPLAEGWVLTLFHSLWQAALVAGMVYLILWMFDIRNPRFRYALGLGGMLVFMMTVLITLVQVMPEEAVAGVSSTELTFTEVVTASIAATDAGWSILAFIRANMPFILRIWAAGAVLLLFRMAGGYQYLRKLVRRGEDTVPEQWVQMIRRIARQLQIRRPVRILHSSSIDMPMVFGHIKPVLLLPVSLLSGLSNAQLEAIFAHELAHIRRHDYLVNLGQQVLESLFFFNPFVWIMSGLLRTEREKVCDDLAMEICHNEKEYVEALSTLELYRSELPAGAMTLLGKKGELLSRIRRLTDPAYGEMGTSKWVLMITLSASFFLVSYFTHSTERNNAGENTDIPEATASMAMVPSYFTQSTDTVPEPVSPSSGSVKTTNAVGADTIIVQKNGSYRYYATPNSNVKVYVRSGDQDTMFYSTDEGENFTFVMPDFPDAPEMPEIDFDVRAWTTAPSLNFVYRMDTLPRLHFNDSLLSKEDKEALQKAREEMRRAQERMQAEQERMQEIMEKYREEYGEAMKEHQKAMHELHRELKSKHVEVIVKDNPEIQRLLRDQERLSRDHVRQLEIQSRQVERLTRQQLQKAQEELQRAQYFRVEAPSRIQVRPYLDRDRMNSFQQDVERMLREDDYLDNDDELKKLELTEDYLRYNGKKVDGGDFSRYLRAYESRFGKVNGKISMVLED